MSPEVEFSPPPRSRLRVSAGAALVLVLLGLVAAVVATMFAPRGVTATVIPDATSGSVHSSTSILIHVLGAVADPGVYSLPAGSRTIDAIAASGGFTEDADRSGVNLARPLSDAEQVRVPFVGDSNSGDIEDGVIDLNSASSDSLETLPGIGPALAGRIIAWREANGAFRAVEDLLEVSGIGMRTLERLRPFVRV